MRKGYTQSFGIDYKKTFSPISMLNTARVLLSFATKDWPLYHFDVKTDILHGALKWEVCMEILAGFGYCHDPKPPPILMAHNLLARQANHKVITKTW